MSLSMYQASVPAFVQMLNNLSAILDKAEAHAKNRKVDPEVLLNYRLAADMFPFIRQVQVAADLAKGAAARLAGVEVPKHDDTEKTFADLKARLAKTVTFVQSFKPDDIDGSEDREINLTLGEHKMSFKGQPYLVHFVMPNFYFHCATAYDILRLIFRSAGKAQQKRQARIRQASEHGRAVEGAIGFPFSGSELVGGHVENKVAI